MPGTVFEERARETHVDEKGRRILYWKGSFPIGWIEEKDGETVKHITGVRGFLSGRREFWGQESPVFGDEKYRGRDPEEEGFKQHVERERNKDYESQLRLAEQYAREYLGFGEKMVVVHEKIPVEFYGAAERKAEKVYKEIEEMMTQTGGELNFFQMILVR
ncbi:hypothetical protein FJZ19_05570 [Candidatus Pacearchaeota archaeon]|nr:hypothetical protein [Candidatus Pacearchaeota archaeon]